MKAYSSREIIALIEADGWELKNIRGSHCHFVHAEKLGKVSVPHPKKNIPLATFKSIMKQAGIII